MAFISQLVYCQDSTKVNKIKFDGSFRIYYARYFNSGNNFLADANRYNFGFGCDLGIIKFGGLSTSVGYEGAYYRVTNIQKAGNTNSTNLKSFNFKLLYEVKLFNNFSIQPFMGIGFPKLKFKSGSKNFGKQKGTDLKIGFNTGYDVSKNFSLFITTEYILSKYQIETVPEFVDYYQDAKAFKISLGVRFM